MMPEAAKSFHLPAKLLLPPFFLSALAFWFCSGCSSPEYSADVVYPFRPDLIVDEAPKQNQERLHGPGQMDKSIARLGELGGKTLDPKLLPAILREELDQALGKYFGTPGAPRVGQSGQKEIASLVKAMNLEGAALREGSLLYRRNCLHCHGLSGDGRGTTGPWVNPHPRDFRQGKFKFISSSPTGNKNKPRREDLLRSLRQGIEGTSMPSFNLLGEKAMEEVTSYVLHLSLRGEIEFEAIRGLLKNKNKVSELFEIIPDAEPEKETLDEFVKHYLADLLRAYQKADQKALEPAPYPKYSDEEFAESIRRGYHLFSSAASDAFGCVSCHQDFGRQPLYQYDEWGTLVRPSNLTMSVYRGGRRPIDLYWRIKRGIPPSKMPAVTAPADEEGKKIWDMVNFIEALPFPGMLPEEIRMRVYSRAVRGIAVNSKNK